MVIVEPTVVNFPSISIPKVQLTAQSAPISAPAPADPTLGAGVGLLLALTGGVTGFALGGLWGAGGGLLLAGGLRNGGRAVQLWRSSGNTTEAGKSATVAAIGLAAASWMGYHAVQKRENP